VTVTGPAERDKWADWVLERGFGGDASQKQRTLAFLRPVRDRVLANAAVRDGDVLLDVGTGDGLIGFGAVPLVGSGRVIFSDVSPALVETCRAAAAALGVLDHAGFAQAAADDLAAIADASVDVVTTRSVLIYVDDKARAFREFHRVLRPGGRVSIFEPINNYFPWDSTEFWGYDATPVRDLVEKIWAREGWGEETDASDPMMNFDERDLVRHAEAAGFAEVHAELDIDIEARSWFGDWDSMLDVAPNPNAETLRESIEGALTQDEAARLEAHIRPLADAGLAKNRSAFCYLWATKEPPSATHLRG
jgi:ubiquinone/menaquinone biosynthesis C-methylase UbiE